MHFKVWQTNVTFTFSRRLCPKPLAVIHTRILNWWRWIPCDQHMRSSLGFSILPKVTSTCRPGESNQRPSDNKLLLLLITQMMSVTVSTLELQLCRLGYFLCTVHLTGRFEMSESENSALCALVTALLPVMGTGLTSSLKARSVIGLVVFFNSLNKRWVNTLSKRSKEQFRGTTTHAGRSSVRLKRAPTVFLSILSWNSHLDEGFVQECCLWSFFFLYIP